MEVSRRSSPNFTKGTKTKTEEWKPIMGYDELYEVSNFGRVKRSKKSYMVTLKRSINLKERILKGEIDKDGYHIVVLRKNNTPKKKKVHRLVAQAFVPNLENKPQVNHIDSIRNNNISTNLEWTYPLENSLHMKNLNRQAKGSKIGNSKLRKNDILYIRKSVLSVKELSIIFLVHESCIRKILNKETWKHL